MDYNPSLVRFPNEAAIIGRIVVGFGELEYRVCSLAGNAIKNAGLILKTLYNIRATSARLDAAENLMQPSYPEMGSANEWAAGMAAVRYCLRIRNQYAHCNWEDDPSAGLFFADLQDSAKRAEWSHHWKHVDVPLLQSQEAYFVFTRTFLLYLDLERQFNRGEIRRRALQAPEEPAPPPLHNLASQHAPPWLGEDLRALHTARAQEAERSASQPERPPSVLKLTEEEWRAKDAKDARKP